jgi:hypothetical protein
MFTRFAIGQIVLYSKDDISYTFEITEIRIDDSGKYYSGKDESGPVGEYLEKYLELIS